MQIKAEQQQDVVSDRPGEKPSHIPKMFSGQEIFALASLVQKLDKVFHQKPTIDLLKKRNFDLFQYYSDITGVSKEQWAEIVDDVKSLVGREGQEIQTKARHIFDLIHDKIISNMKFLILPDEYDPRNERSTRSPVGARDLHFLKTIFKGAPKLPELLDGYRIKGIEGHIRVLKSNIARGKASKEETQIKIDDLEKQLKAIKTPQNMQFAAMAEQAWHWMKDEMAQAKSLFQQIEVELRKLDAANMPLSKRIVCG